jgi:S-DNA-T family DNA segregation ATPase FtsK/SpoIIIE
MNLSRPLEQADHELASWEKQLIQHAYLWSVGPQLVKHQVELQASTAEVLNYWKAVQNLCKWLCEVLFKQSRPAQAIEELRRFIFAENERECQAELSDPAWHDTVVLQGRIDAVVRQPGTGRVCALELKLGQTSPEADLAQVCLYHLLLSKTDPSRVAKDLALLTFQPEVHERVWKGSELEAAQASLLELIGKLAQVREPKPPRVERPEGKIKEMARRLLEGFKEFGAPIQLEGKTLIGPAFYRFLAKPAQRVKADKILSMATTVWPRLRDVGVEQPPQIAMERGLITIDVQRPDRLVVNWDANLFRQFGESPKAASRFPVGVDVEGKWKYADLSEPEHSHFLVAGTNGSGKTEWLKMVVGSLCLTHTPKALSLILIDPKGNAFPAISDSPFLSRPIVSQIDESLLALLEEMIRAMEDRYRLFEKVQVKDLKQYNESQPKLLPRLVCICDEYANLVLADSRKTREIEPKIGRISAMGRAAGLHLFLATQKPSRDIVKGVIKANLNARVAFRVNERLESKITLEQPGAETLLGKGDLLFKDLGPAIRLQSPLISDRDLKAAARC